MSVVSPTSRFAYKSIRLHLSRFAYTIWDVSPTLKLIRQQPNIEELISWVN